MNHVTDMDCLVERLHLTEAQIAAVQKEVSENFQKVNLFD
jgi:hypothetical protein